MSNSLQDFMDFENTKSKLMMLIEENSIEDSRIDEDFLAIVAHTVTTLMDVIMENNMTDEEDAYLTTAIENNEDVPLLNLVFALMDVTALYAILRELEKS